MEVNANLLVPRCKGVLTGEFDPETRKKNNGLTKHKKISWATNYVPGFLLAAGVVINDRKLDLSAFVHNREDAEIAYPTCVIMAASHILSTESPFEPRVTIEKKHSTGPVSATFLIIPFSLPPTEREKTSTIGGSSPANLVFQDYHPRTDRHGDGTVAPPLQETKRLLGVGGIKVEGPKAASLRESEFVVRMLNSQFCTPVVRSITGSAQLTLHVISDYSNEQLFTACNIASGLALRSFYGL